jgi:AhpD family alkylhydroperoxidase
MSTFTGLLVEPPRRSPWYLAPFLWLTRKMTGKDPLPARLLTWFPKGAVGAGVFEVTAAGAPGDLDGRALAVARIVSSAVAGCPFCLDMNAATYQRAGLSLEELRAAASLEPERWATLGPREAVVARYARALSLTPVELDDALAADLRAAFSSRQLVVLASTIAQVNFWSRFNQGLGVPSAGFCEVAYGEARAP